MYIIFIIGLIVVLNSILGTFFKRKKAKKLFKKNFNVKINTYISYVNIIYGFFLSGLIIYLLYDKDAKSIDIYSLLIATLVVVIVAYKAITQYFYKPFFTEEGILFYNGLLLQWNNINEIKPLGSTKNGDGILFVGGKISSKVAVREKIVIDKEDLFKVESILSTKTNIK